MRIDNDDIRQEIELAAIRGRKLAARYVRLQQLDLAANRRRIESQSTPHRFTALGLSPDTLDSIAPEYHAIAQFIASGHNIRDARNVFGRTFADKFVRIMRQNRRDNR